MDGGSKRRRREETRGVLFFFESRECGRSTKPVAVELLSLPLSVTAKFKWTASFCIVRIPSESS